MKSLKRFLPTTLRIALTLMALMTMALATSCGRNTGAQREVNPSTKPGSDKSLKAYDGPKVSYDEVKPVFKTKCSACHSSGTHNWMNEELTTKYIQTRGSVMHKRAVLKEGKYMPPNGSKDTTEEERELLAQFIATVQSGPEEQPAAGTEATSPSGSENGKEPPSPDTDINQRPLPDKFAFAQVCFGCHGNWGENSTPGTPNLVGLKAPYFETTINDFKNGRRSNPVMNSFANGITAEQMELLKELTTLMEYTVKPPITDPELYVEGKALMEVNSCKGCHLGPNGQPTLPNYPGLIYQDKAYLKSQMTAFLKDERQGTVMKMMLEGFVNTDGNKLDLLKNQRAMDAIAEYFGSYVEEN